jgi:iron(II)-dependent oxidoreductase
MATANASIENCGGLAAQFQAGRMQSDALFDILKPSAVFERPIAQRHRMIFYIGHLDAFDAIQICREGMGLPSPDPELDSLFQAGIDPDSSHLPSDTPADWPSLAQVRSYVDRCRRRVDEQLAYAPEDSVCMALEHRLMHLETLAYMFHNLPYAFKRATRAGEALDETPAMANDWIEVPSGTAVLGKSRDGNFGWDNEYEETLVSVPGFCIQRRKVSNGEYLRFVRDGASFPHFWVKRGDAFFYRGMFREIPLPLDWPVYVSQREAQAYASWLGKKLPTEAQYHRASYSEDSSEPRKYPWGNATPSRKHGNFDFALWDPESVESCPSGDSSLGIRQLVGNGWEWTRSVFAPLPGFRPHPAYPGYSANFFDDQHYVIKGASTRTAVRLLRRSFRNWFRADYPYVYAGFRCVDN